MNGRLLHRGPDDEGYFVEGPAGLAMRRLSIIDLATGHQPIAGEGNRVHVVCNGEIYNYAQLTDVLVAHGHRFTTKSDTEVIVHGWEQHGLASLAQLEGMFALAIWDSTTRTLVLARDRLGIKPLYYAVLPDQIVFASELKALVEHPAIERRLDLTALSRYLMHEYVPAPLSIFRAVRKLPAGHWLSYTEGQLKIEPYWDLPACRHLTITESDAITSLRELLELSVREHLVSDVPLGMFLSGGIDSSAVAAFAARHVNGRLRTFSIGFEERSADESRHSRLVADVLGTDHHEAILGSRTAVDLFGALPELLDEPLADASIVPTYLLSQFTRRSVTVALSGDGGDEIFAGYPTYQAHRVAALFDTSPGRILRKVLHPVVRRLPTSRDDDLSVDFRLKRFFDGLHLTGTERHLAWMGAFTPNEQLEILTPNAVAAMDEPVSWSTVRAVGQERGRHPVERAQYLDLKGYLGEGVLTKVDRASMACSLEVRVPMLDRRIVEFAARLPLRLKVHGLTTKYVLKKALAGMVPDAILRRPKKGFGVPLGRWFRGALRPLLGDMLAPDALHETGLFRVSVVERLLAEHASGQHNHRKKLYTLLAFQLWASRYRVVL